METQVQPGRGETSRRVHAHPHPHKHASKPTQVSWLIVSSTVLTSAPTSVWRCGSMVRLVLPADQSATVQKISALLETLLMHVRFSCMRMQCTTLLWRKNAICAFNHSVTSPLHAHSHTPTHPFHLRFPPCSLFPCSSSHQLHLHLLVPVAAECTACDGDSTQACGGDAAMSQFSFLCIEPVGSYSCQGSSTSTLTSALPFLQHTYTLLPCGLAMLTAHD